VFDVLLIARLRLITNKNQELKATKATLVDLVSAVKKVKEIPRQ